ncbi:hypothetical protein CKO42_17345 [Lamprobacter modestohalophilus]|uniref:Restriction endonuclease n=1 Tax=Lamprobacter modestohalophilus TaxID=1064514 RepID=A0A9X1B569_9GAMM|nr:hypothetical protein [Lamprobacter modestohalophilus]MBK1620173.1 hypothetical protein [Lamprobacter modestohalophilus]
MADHLSLQEWTRLTPETCGALKGRHLSGDQERAQAAALSKGQRLIVQDLHDGLSIEARSWVGRVTLGDLTITLSPKITGLPLLGLLRYAYRLNELSLHNATAYATTTTRFQDLLLEQLRAEATALLARGLQRDYRRTAAHRQSPRGQIDFARLAGDGPLTRASLPCIDYPRHPEITLNLVLAAGLAFGVARAGDLELRVQLRDLVRRMDLDDVPPALDPAMINGALNALDRRTAHYQPSLALIALLLQGSAVSLDDPPAGVTLSGFLFDMNAFFQALLGRFLREHLPGCEVVGEHRLHGIFTYDSQHNPIGNKGPVPRPDFMVRNHDHKQVVLDAKYRDLSVKPLPSYMLYQLAIYALTQAGSLPSAILLYPTLGAVGDQIVLFNDTLVGAPKARVILRAVNLLALVDVLGKGSGQQAKRHRERLARQYVFGAETSTNA